MPLASRFTFRLLMLACLAWPQWSAAAPPKIAAASGHVLAVRADGTMVGWGQNNFGQLGLGTIGAEQTVPLLLSPNNVTDIAAGNMHSLAVVAGSVRVWGSNTGGQLGFAVIGSLLFPTTVDNVGDVVGVAAGDVHSLALRSDGTVLFWGTNISGATSPPGPVAGLGNALAVAAGSYHSLALRGDGTVAAWGSNALGQLGDGSITNRPAPVSVAGLSGVVAIAAGGLVSLALKSDGTVWLWGNGQPTAAAVAGLAGISAIATSGEHHLALKADGTVMAWGSNSHGQLGDGTAASRSVPQAVTGLSGIAAIAAGQGRSLAMRADGTVVEWGGVDADGIRLTATPIPGVADAAGIVANSNHLLVRKTDQSLLGFGANSTGQLGNGTQLAAGSFQPVSGAGAVSRITTYVRHSMAVLPDGRVMAWGQFFGQVCRGFDSEFQLSPAPVPALTNVAAIATGNGHTLVLHTDGSVSACGSNGSGRLGVPGGDAGTPISIPTLSGVSAVAVGAAHSLALLADGTVRAWGENGNGQLGIGSEDNAAAPVAVPGLTGVIAIAAYDNYSVAVKGDGSVWAWGNNSNGQLGDGTTSRRTSPVQVTGLTAVQAVALTSDRVLALKSDGTVMAWGQNSVGQLGDGTTLERLSPVAVAGLTGVSGLAAGTGTSYALLADGTLRGWGLYSSCLFGCEKRDVVGVGGSGLLNLLTDQISPFPFISRNGDEAVVPGSVVSFAVDFTEPVTGVDLADFTLVTTDVVGAALISVTGSGSNYVVTLNVGTGSGDVRLRVLDNDSIQDAAGNVLGGTGAGNGQVTSSEMFIVGVVQQVITITPIADPLLTQGIVHITVTGGASGNGVTYNSITPATCSAATSGLVNGMRVTLLAAGVCTVTADQTGNASYLPANQETYSFNIIQGYTLTVQVLLFGANGNGTVSSLPAGINCTNDTSPCTLALPAGTSIDLTATPAALSDFTSWSGDCSGTSTCALVMNADRTVTARFDGAPTATLSVSTTGDTVLESPFRTSGINCTLLNAFDDCSAAYRLGVAAALVAIPVGQSTFTGWTGDCDGNGPCNLLLTANRAVSATFQSGAAPTYVMTVITTGNGAGSVSSMPAGISCGHADICQASYPAGTMITLSAVADAGSTFAGWSSAGGAAACTGTGSCSVTLSAASRITATFTHAGTAQTISFSPPASRIFNAANPFFAATLSATSALPVSLSSLSPAVCAASGVIVTVNATGTCFLRAVQPGNATFAAALPQVRGFVINRAAQTITFPDIADFDWNGGSAILSATASSGLPVTYRLDSGPCVITGNVVTSAAPGVCEIAALQSGNANYLEFPFFVSRVVTVTGALTVPGAPLIGLATPTAGGASIAFSAPNTFGGTFLTGYTATCNPGAIVASAMASPIVVTGLANGVVHSCSVTASNSVGTGPSSASVSVTPQGAPDAPIIGSAIALDGGALVSFSAPGSDGGSPIVGYAVTCNPGNINASGSTSPIAVTGLTNGAAHTCVVRAINLIGTSAASASVSVTPQPQIALLSAVSRKSHGAAGSHAIAIDITQPVDGAVTVEPRGAAAGHQLVMTFNQPVNAAGSASVRDAGGALIASADTTVAGNTVVVALAAIAGSQRVTIAVNGISGANGSVNPQVSLGLLVGDVSNSRAVTAADIAAIKASLGLPVNSVLRARMDLDADGLITPLDVTAARARTGQALP